MILTLEDKMLKPHPYRLSEFSGAGNCECGMPEKWRAHQPLWWRWMHNRAWR